MKELSKQEYWNTIHRDKSLIMQKLFYIPFFRFFLLGRQNGEFYDECKKFILPEYKTAFEVGCAPGNYLIQFAKMFSLSPAGIEYTEEGVNLVRKNLTQWGLTGEIVHGDFFDSEFLERKNEKYSVTFSMGFIEHFDEIERVIANHFLVTEKGGLVICTLPNLYYWNKYFVPKEVLDIHNLEIMQLDVLKKHFSQHGEILSLKYYGGLFNLGAFMYKNPIGEKIRLLLFILQRLLFDPVSMVLRSLGLDFNNKYLSPSILVVIRKYTDKDYE